MAEEKGPDRIVPTTDLITWKTDGAVKIRMGKEWPSNMETISIPTWFKKQCKSGGAQTAMKVKRGGQWISWSYNQYYEEAITAAKGFIALGLETYKAVCIYGFNAPEWIFSEIGCIHAGGKAVGLYPTNSAEANKFIINDCECNILVVEDEKALNKMLSVRNELEHVKKIVVFEEKPKTGAHEGPDVVYWNELLELGKNQTDEEMKERLANMAINTCAMLVYTSGTTGNPKGVMLSHDNVYWTAKVASDYIQMRENDEVIVSYLPLSHIAGNMLDVWCPLTNLATVYFADKMALKGTLVATLQEARPTIFFGVPRVYEKIMEGMRAKGKEIRGLKKKVSQACKQAGLDYHLNGKESLMLKVGRKVIFKKVREALGFDRTVSFFTGAAPISMECMKYFLSLDIILLELYGMSECCGPQSMSYLNTSTAIQYKLGSCGPILPGAKNRLADPDNKGEGEVCMWGRHVMMGYLNREDKTTEDMDEEGWMHSGDLGTVDSDGHLFITGRKKELIITAGGENVAPVPIEDKIKEEVPAISNAIVIGDRQKYLSAFLTFKVEMDNDSPTDKLTPPALDWCQSIGSRATKVNDILRGDNNQPDAKVMAAVQAGIDRANKAAVSNAAKVQRWTILPVDVSMPGGELGPTLKLKRFFFNKKYSDAIEKLYAQL